MSNIESNLYILVSVFGTIAMSSDTATTTDSNPSAEPNKGSSKERPQKQEAWGNDLYPERRGTFKAKWSKVLTMTEGKENLDKLKCEKNVFECVKASK